VGILTTFWIDLIGTALALVLANGALTGKLYSHGRGGSPRLIASIRSSCARIAFLLVSAGLVAWVVVDLRHKLSIR
jgi:hypothetical protein